MSSRNEEYAVFEYHARMHKPRFESWGPEGVRRLYGSRSSSGQIIFGSQNLAKPMSTKTVAGPMAIPVFEKMVGVSLRGVVTKRGTLNCKKCKCKGRKVPSMGIYVWGHKEEEFIQRRCRKCGGITEIVPPTILTGKLGKPVKITGAFWR